MEKFRSADPSVQVKVPFQRLRGPETFGMRCVLVTGRMPRPEAIEARLDA
jgi:hypothetical protein